MTGGDNPGLQRPRFGQRLGVRLAALLGLGAVLSAMLAMGAMLAMAWYYADRDNTDEAHQVARSLAFALQAPVSFADVQGIRDAVAVLKSHPQVLGAWVHDQTGVLLHSVGTATLLPGHTGQGSLADGWLQVSAPIVAGNAGDAVGHITLHTSLHEVQRKLRVQAMAAAGASLVAALLALVVSQRLARRISVPVVRLAETAAKITRERNYELRLPPAGHDEVGVAVDAFNHMLVEIGKRGNTLEAMNGQLQQQAQAAQAARAQAESASLAKTRFLANMSHELRSPLNGVIGAAQLLQAQGADAVRRAELVEIIRTSGGNLLGLIEHVLDLARIESGALELQPQDFNVLDCIESAVMSVSAQAAAKGLMLSCDVDPAMSLWRHGDDARLRQLVLNLLGNAVKFTARGDITVEVHPVEAVGHRVQIAVRDTGIGIAPEALETIFEPFQQADASTTRRFGGSGLGLAICRDLSRLMGGEVSAQSIPSLGSSLTLELPLPPAIHAGDEGAALDLCVAWCEPHEPSARALAALLQRLGCQAQRCHYLAELQTFLTVSEAMGASPWFIVALDSEFGREMLAGALPRLDPCRVLSIHSAADTQQSCPRETPGLARAMTRPVLRSTLVSRLANVCGMATSNLVTQATLSAGLASARVLLAEDDAINQEVVRSMLECAGFACTVAHNGLSALELLQHSRYDLVLMDWQMPDMDGLEATRRLRAGLAGELNRGVPVVALTANAFAEDRSACLAAGMNDFVTKPVLGSHLVAVAERWALRARAPHGEPRPMDRLAAPAAAEAGVPDYDPGVLASLPTVANGSNPRFVQHLLGLFDRTVGQTFATIEQGITSGDLKEVQRGVHSLKSISGQVGAMVLAAEAARFEAALRRGELDATELPPMLLQLRTARQRFAAALAVADAA